MRVHTSENNSTRETVIARAAGQASSRPPLARPAGAPPQRATSRLRLPQIHPPLAPRFVVTLDAPPDESESPIRIPLALTGKWVRDGSEFSISLDDLKEIVRNFSKRGNGEINVDYDHASEMPEVAAGGPVPSAGRILKLEGPVIFETPHLPSYVGHPLPRGEGKHQDENNCHPLPMGEGKKEVTNDRRPLHRGEGENQVRIDSGHLHGEESKDKGNNAPTLFSSGEGNKGNRAGLNPLPGERVGRRGDTGEGSCWILYGIYEPTPRARKLIEQREYRYISPAINWAGRDKRTGKIDGTTLTSVALTNRPFLEELPQIRLSDPAFQFVDVGDAHVDTSLGVNDGNRDSGLGGREKPAGHDISANHEARNPNPDSKGGIMKQVKLSVEDGKIKVEHDDFGQGYFADPAELRRCMTDLGVDAAAPDAMLASELAGLAGGAESGGALTLSECVAEIRRRLEPGREISIQEASALLSENEAGGKTIAAADYFRARVEQELDEAVKSGKVLPRQRDDWRKIALSDFPTFRKIVAGQKPQVPLRPVGLSGSGPEDAQTQVRLLAEQRMKERSISFGQALSEIGREQPGLAHEYRRAVTG